MKTSIPIVLAFLLCSCSDKFRFELVDPDDSGVSFVNRIIDSDSLHVMNFEYIYNGAGVGIADLDKDGRQDLVFAGNQLAPRIYLNQGKFRFSDISSDFKDLDQGQWYSGVTFADINADGWMDVYLTCTAYTEAAKRKNRLYINQGLQEDGRLLFIDMAESYGIADDSYTVHAAFLDYDIDGDLDLFLLNNFDNDRLSAGYRPRINDGTAPSNDDLYRNNGDGTFSNVSVEAGIVCEGFALGLAVGDVNKDGYPDIYVSNDYISNDLLYINQGDGTFQNRIAHYLSYQTKSSMGNDMADINNDGFPEIFTLDMMPESYHRKKQTIGGFEYVHYINDAKYGYEPQYLRNMLHLHNGLLHEELLPFSEVGQMLGLYQTEWSWAPLFADYDNDGDKDLIVSNGYPKDMTDKDWTNYASELRGSDATPEHAISKMPAVRVANYAFENLGDLRFEQRTREWFDPQPSYSYGSAFADLDNDGDLDLVFNNLNDQAFIFKNNTMEQGEEEKNYLRVKLLGNEPNLQALGAKLELWCAGDYQFQEHFLSRGYASNMEAIIHFGLSDHRKIDSLIVSWPSGNRSSVLRNIEANQLLTVEERDALPSNAGERGQGENVEYVFSLRDGMLIYEHQQDDFVDYHYSQPLIPHKFSQIGPCMATGDLNNDGEADVIIGATNSLPTRVFIKEGNTFRERNVSGLSTHKDFSESDLAIVDIDLDGDQDVLAVAGGYENPEEEYIHYMYINNGGSFSGVPLPTSSFPASVLRPCDFDHDGDMDLFIGARIGLEIFPFSANSWILINEQGVFTKDLSLNFYLGMVTDAVWSDYDGDGWEDLLVTREWNSIEIIKNIQGRSVQIQKVPGLNSKHGIWYSIVAGDFDLDGDEDYILGNLGDNHRFTVSEEYPLKIYALDIDMNGTLDPVSTGFWRDKQGVMREYPVHYFDDLMRQSPYYVRNNDNYSSFSYATIHDILDSAIMERVDYTLHCNTTSSYILWNRGNQFEWEKLPASAQVAPIKKMIVHDFNRDKFPDLILAGNDHTYDVNTGYYDANKGLVLMSSNNKPLSTMLAPAQSGLLLHGMVESLLHLDGDSPLILAGINRDSVRVFSY